jgi:hypothetical protein
MTSIPERLRPVARLVSLPVSRTGRTLVILIGFFAVLDIVTTAIGLSQPGVIREQNALGRALWEMGGPAGLIAAKLASFTFVAVAWRLLARRMAPVHAPRLTSLLLVFLVLLNVTAAAANLITLTRLTVVV